MADITPQRAPATIHSLAPEIMARVLELVEPADDWQTVPARHLAMCRTSLVCRSWTLEARIILWRKLAIGREGQAERILASPALGSFRTQEVAFWGSVNLTASSTAEVLARLHGVKHLELLFFDRRLKDRILDSAIFGLLSVKGLTSLTLDTVAINTVPATFPTFSLISLNICGGSLPPFPFPWTYLLTPSLRELRSDGSQLGNAGLRDAFILVIPHLHRLELLSLPPPSLDRAFVNATNLSHLESGLTTGEASRAISLVNSLPFPNQLSTLTISASAGASASVQLFAKLFACPTLETLPTICFGSLFRRNMVASKKEGKVLRQWEEKGVKVKFRGET